LVVLAGCETESPQATDDDTRPWTREVVAQRLDEIRNTSTEAGRVAMLTELAERAGPDAADLLQHEVSSRVTTWRRLDRLLLIDAWSRLEPAAATRWANVGASNDMANVAMEIAVANWARRDPQQVISAFPDIGGAGLDGVVSGWFEGGHPGLEVWIVEGLEVSTVPGQAALANYFRRAIEAEGLEGARRRAEQMISDFPGVHRRVTILRQAASEITMIDPDAGIAYYESLQSDEDGPAVLSEVAQRLAHHDGRRTLEWLRARTEVDDDERMRITRAAYQIWGTWKRPEAMAWALEIPEAERSARWFTGVASRMVGMLSWEHPEQAIEWSALIPDPKERELALVSIVRRWRGKNLIAAEAWLESSDLSEEARAKARFYPKNFKGRKPPGG